MNENEKQIIPTKKFFIKFGIFTAFAVTLLVILGYVIVFSRSSWNNNLKNCVEIVLEENIPGMWSVESNVEINNSSKLRSAGYRIRNRVSGETGYAFITRVATYYGPMAAVFTCSEDGKADFVGYVSFHGRIKNQITQNKINKRVSYEAERIPIYLEISVGDESDE